MRMRTCWWWLITVVAGLALGCTGCSSLGPAATAGPTASTAPASSDPPSQDSTQRATDRTDATGSPTPTSTATRGPPGEQPVAVREATLDKHPVVASVFPVHRSGSLSSINVAIRAVNRKDQFSIHDVLNDGDIDALDTTLGAPDGLQLLDGVHHKIHLPVTARGRCLCQPHIDVTDTDDLGGAAHGLTLSRRRAKTVTTHLRQLLPDSDVSYRSSGRGEANPAVPNTSEANRRKNRRVILTYRRR